MTVIYKAPKDTAAFEKYYARPTSRWSSQGQPEIGFTRAELTRFNSNLDGSKPVAVPAGGAVLPLDGRGQERA